MSAWDVSRLTVKLGDHNIKVNTEVKHVERKVKRVVRHRGFDSRTLVSILESFYLELLHFSMHFHSTMTSLF